MDLIKSINDMAIQEAKKPAPNLDAKFQEWRLLKQQEAVVKAVTKVMTTRIAELEDDFLPVVKEMKNQQTVIDNAIVEYKTRKTTSIKYKEAFEKALEIATKKQREVLNTFLAGVTDKGEKEFVEIADPDLAEFLKDLKGVDVAKLTAKFGSIEKMPAAVLKQMKKEKPVKEGALDPVVKALSKVKMLFKSFASSIMSKLKASAKAADDLMKVATSEPVAESYIDQRKFDLVLPEAAPENADVTADDARMKRTKKLPVGKHNNMDDSLFDPVQLRMGVKVEYEHTNDFEVAKAIAKDHLAELPDYYTRLAKMEKEGRAALQKTKDADKDVAAKAKEKEDLEAAKAKEAEAKAKAKEKEAEKKVK